MVSEGLKRERELAGNLLTQERATSDRLRSLLRELAERYHGDAGCTEFTYGKPACSACAALAGIGEP